MKSNNIIPSYSKNIYLNFLLLNENHMLPTVSLNKNNQIMNSILGSINQVLFNSSKIVFAHVTKKTEINKYRWSRQYTTVPQTQDVANAIDTKNILTICCVTVQWLYLFTDGYWLAVSIWSSDGIIHHCISIYIGCFS